MRKALPSTTARRRPCRLALRGHRTVSSVTLFFTLFLRSDFRKHGTSPRSFSGKFRAVPWSLIALFLLGVAAAHAGEFEARYSARLSELDQERPDSVCKARDMLRTFLPQSSSIDRASMLLAFLKFNGAVAEKSRDEFGQAMMPVYDKASEVLNNNHWKSGSASFYLRGDPRVRKAIGPWLECGFGIYMSEGIFYSGADIAAVEQLAPLLPPDLRAWVNLLKHEGGFDDVVEDDNGLRLSWQELADRLHRWEKFLRAHPSLDEEIRPEVHRMAWFFFFGLNNTPLQSFDSDRIDPEVLSAWRRFANDPSPSRYTATMRQLLGLLDANAYKLSPDTKALAQWIETERKADIRQ
jgi:hypothetical protein